MSARSYNFPVEGAAMSVRTYEGVVDHGQIKLKADAHLPDNTKVYVVVPESQVEQIAHLYSPHFAHPEQSSEFKSRWKS
jgi:hypothetical protein